ncbi:hypothetical protein [Priestia megaterium]|uniref:hypothetical protein n=1 Tax=Priestia megaterium TaxID=1404 RepID=UPI00263AF8BE|nr:hypothetical protein [Priestia megaterium]MDN4865876.1 hypothetical protein [Priestia megaterium]
MNTSKIILIFLFVFDLFFLVLSVNHYYLIFLGSVSHLFVMVINLIFLVLWAILRKLKGSLIFLCFFVGIAVILFQVFLYTLTPKTYDSITSPLGIEKLYIAHSNFSLGETSYSYNFYQRKGYIFMKELVDQNKHLVTRDNPPGDTADMDIKMLGLDAPHWKNEKEVSFNSRQGTITIYLE